MVSFMSNREILFLIILISALIGCSKSEEKNPEKKEQRSNVLKYELLDEQITDVPAVATIESKYLVSGDVSEDSLKALLKKLYIKKQSRGGFQFYKRPTKITILLFTSKEDTKDSKNIASAFGVRKTVSDRGGKGLNEFFANKAIEVKSRGGYMDDPPSVVSDKFEEVRIIICDVCVQMWKEENDEEEKLKIQKAEASLVKRLKEEFEFTEEPLDYSNEVYTYKNGKYAYHEREDSRRLYPVKIIDQDYKCGYINKDGNIVIELKFEGCGAFSEGLAQVNLGTVTKPLTGFIDESGNEIFTVRFVLLVLDFSEGLAAFQHADGKWGYIDKTGRVVIPPTYEVAEEFHNGLAFVSSKKGYFEGLFINSKGEILNSIKAIFPFHFSDGLAPVKNEKTGKWGYVDTKGNIVIKEKFDEASLFSEGLATVKIERKYGFIDTEGKFVIKPQFNMSADFSYSISDFQEGLAKLQIKGKYGFIDRSGKIAIPPSFEYARDFSSGLAVVKIHDKYGYIDREGNVVIEPQFKEANDFKGELAIVEKYADKVYIDKQGKVVWSETLEIIKRRNKNFNPRNIVRDGNLIRTYINEQNFEYWVDLESLHSSESGQMLLYKGIALSDISKDIEIVEIDCFNNGYRIHKKSSSQISFETGQFGELKEKKLSSESEWSRIVDFIGGLTETRDLLCYLSGTIKEKSDQGLLHEKPERSEPGTSYEPNSSPPPTPDQPKYKITVKKVPRIDCETPDGRIIFQGVQEGKCPKGTIEVKKIIEQKEYRTNSQ